MILSTDFSIPSSLIILFDRLLREMGWNEADQEEYEITEDEKKEFQNLSKQVTCTGFYLTFVFQESLGLPSVIFESP